jgi:hypothetical protein
VLKNPPTHTGWAGAQASVARQRTAVPFQRLLP